MRHPTPKMVTAVAAVMVILGAISRTALGLAGAELGWGIIGFPFVCGVVAWSQPNVKPRTLWLALIAMPVFFCLIVSMAGLSLLKTVDFEQKTLDMHRWAIRTSCINEGLTEGRCERWSRCTIDTLVKEHSKKGAFEVVTKADEIPSQMALYDAASNLCAQEGEFPAPQPQAALDVTASPPPPLPSLSPSDDGVNVVEIAFKGGTRGWLYVPPGLQKRKTKVPAVVIAPAGSDLLHGMALREGDAPEHLPYLKAGFVVLAYELAGEKDAKAFQAAHGGLQNAMNAVAFLRERVPVVDPSAIFAAGHSSAANVALLLAAHDDKLRGAVAYNSSGQGCWVQNNGYLETLASTDPNLESFCQRTRAASHFGHFAVPAFFFGSKEDTSPTAESVHSAAKLLNDTSGVPVTLKIVEEGDHYHSMIDEGIPAAIAWMNERLADTASEDTP